MCKDINFESEDFLFEEFNDEYIKSFFISEIIVQTLKIIEERLKDQKVNRNEKDFENYLLNNIVNIYEENIQPNIYFIFLIIIVTILGGDCITFKKNIPFVRIISKLKYYSSLMIKFFVNSKGQAKNEEIQTLNLFYKKKIKEILSSKENIEKAEFSDYSEKGEDGINYYENFLKLVNNDSCDSAEDMEISIYNNLKKENNERKDILKAMKEIIEEFIDGTESKKGFIALLHQSFYVGYLRNEIVRIFFIIFIFLFL